MKILKKIRKKEKSNNEIYDLVQKLNDKILEQNIKLEAYNQNVKELRCQRIENLENLVINMEAHKIAEYEVIIKWKGNENKSQKEIIDTYAKKIDKLEKENSSLKEKNINLTLQVEHLSSDAYLRRELPAEEPKVTKTQGMKRSRAGAGARKILKEKNETAKEI